MKQAIVLGLLCLSLAAPAVLAADVGAGSYTCHVTAGDGNPAVGVSIGTPAGNVGGCDIVTTTVSTTVHDIGGNSGCAVYVDTNGDGLSDANATAGQTYGPADFFAVCDLGVVNADVYLNLTAPAA